MLSRPQKSITTRSSPTPKPPCGGAPYLKQLMYDWMLSSGISCAFALSVGGRPGLDAKHAGQQRLAYVLPS